MKIYSHERLARLALDRGLSEEYAQDLRIVSSVLPFKVNEYVVDELIDWSMAPDDPIFRLTFPHRDMLPSELFESMAALRNDGASREQLRNAASQAQATLNPHPGDQLEANVPQMDGRRLNGLQHKYRETLLVFPSQGQTCHSYCGYCFRWAQFVRSTDLRQALSNPGDMTAYLMRHPNVTDVLFTGGDPMIMTTEGLTRWIEPLLDQRLDAIRTVRFGTKALSYWPARFTDGEDADQLMRLLERCIVAGRQVAVMAHFSHPRELETTQVRAAISRIRSTGAIIRSQSPVVAHVNDAPVDWSKMWQLQVELGVIPYYMFVERDTGARSYFGIPLARAFTVYTDAMRAVSGLARTARGPVMSAALGKVLINGTADIGDQRVFVLTFLQAREPERVGKPFFAAFDPNAQWFDELKPVPSSTSLYSLQSD